jgi:hypothetical protein
MNPYLIDTILVAVKSKNTRIGIEAKTLHCGENGFRAKICVGVRR